MINFDQAKSIAESIKRKEFLEIDPDKFTNTNYHSVIDDQFHECNEFWIFYPLRSIKICHGLNMHESSIIVSKNGWVFWGKNYLGNDEEVKNYISLLLDRSKSTNHDLMFDDPTGKPWA